MGQQYGGGGGQYPGGGYPPQGQYPQQQQYQQQQYQQQQYQQPAQATAAPLEIGDRSHLLTILLSTRFGMLGFDRFYLGKIGTGILKAITVGGFGIWWLIDAFKVLYNNMTDIDGKGLRGQDRRDPTMLLFLAATGGIFGFDRFYLGQTGLGLAKLFTLGGLGIWWLVDIYLILKGRLEDSRGLPIQREDKRYQSVALLLSLFAGQLGLDRHYLGHRSLAMLKFFTFGGFFFWFALDVVLIILNSLKDSEGNALVQE